jgi:hypothetical protein
MKNQTIIWQKIAVLAVIATAFLCSILITGCQTTKASYSSVDKCPVWATK